MSVMSIRVDSAKKKALKVIATIEGKSMGGIVSELIEEYIQKNKAKIQKLSKNDTLDEIMKLSEPAFMEWDNDEDEIYNEL
ncbi:MAG: hypothetical protein DRH93_20920 [Deltaproteobacteria bacterium]|nr:MAG: hypothetical protein DRH93_20920 [Deltaproteobacteria bacterium]